MYSCEQYNQFDYDPKNKNYGGQLSLMKAIVQVLTRIVFVPMIVLDVVLAIVIMIFPAIMILFAIVSLFYIIIMIVIVIASISVIIMIHILGGLSFLLNPMRRLYTAQASFLEPNGIKKESF